MGTTFQIQIGQNYMRMTFPGDGTVSADWFGLPFDTDGNPTALGSKSTAVAASNRVFQFAQSTISGAPGSPIQIPLKKTWAALSTEYAFGECHAAWSSADGQSGVAKAAASFGRPSISVVVPASGSTVVTLASPSACVLGAQATCTVSAS